MAGVRELEAQPTEADRLASAPSQALAPVQARVLGLQRQAGNRAVAQLLQRKQYDLSTAATVVLAPGTTPEAPATYCAAILKNAGISSSDWFSNFTDFTFLGHGLGDPIHQDLADHLTKIEKKFAEDYGGPDKKPAEAAKALGITSVGGSRKYPTSAPISMHLFGLAIDVNYTANPFIGSSANDVFKHAGALIGEKKIAYKDGMKFEDLSRVNDAFRSYIAYLDKTDEELQKQIDANADESLKGQTAADVRKQIQKDFDFVAKKWERTGDDQKAQLKKTGFMNLDKRFIDGIGLSWGASYGDIMHFDMRNKGRGATIYSEGVKYKNEKKKEAAGG